MMNNKEAIDELSFLRQKYSISDDVIARANMLLKIFSDDVICIYSHGVNIRIVWDGKPWMAITVEP
jgi:hypothetical protein